MTSPATTSYPALDSLTCLPLLERLRESQAWEKTGSRHDLLRDAADEIERLRTALAIAMAYMSHGVKYEGPFRLRPEDYADFEKCRAALNDSEAKDT